LRTSRYEEARPQSERPARLGAALRFGAEWAHEIHRRHGDVFAFDLPAKNGGVMVVHPDDVRTGLMDKDEITRQAFPTGNLLARTTGDDIITRGGEARVERRNITQPSSGGNASTTSCPSCWPRSTACSTPSTSRATTAPSTPGPK